MERSDVEPPCSIYSIQSQTDLQKKTAENIHQPDMTTSIKEFRMYKAFTKDRGFSKVK
jgi:hypothetical protein